MKSNWKCSCLLPMLIVTFFFESIIAQELKLVVSGTPNIFKNTDETEDKTIEPSAVTTIGDGRFLLIADDKDDGNGKSLKIVETATGKLLKLLDKIHPTKKNPKWEAITRDDQGNFFVIGSHNNADAQKLAARSLMFRFKLKNETATDAKKIEIDTTSIKEFNIKESLSKLGLYSLTPAENKVKIEGLSIRKNSCSREIFIGFREPFDTIQVYSAEIPKDSAENIVKLSLKPFFHFNAGKTADNTTFQLSSIEYVPEFKGFVVLTSTETTTKPIFHGNALWFISDEAIKTSQPQKFSESYKIANAQKLSEFQTDMKAEGICFLNRKTNNNFRFAIVYDNDAEDTKIGGRLQFIELSVN